MTILSYCQWLLDYLNHNKVSYQRCWLETILPR